MFSHLKHTLIPGSSVAVMFTVGVFNEYVAAAIGLLTLTHLVIKIRRDLRK